MAHCPKGRTWLAHCSPCRKGSDRAPQHELKSDLTLRLRDVEDAKTGGDSIALCRDAVWTPPLVAAPQRAAKKRDGRTNAVFASGQFGKRMSQSQELSGRFLLFQWKTCAAG